MEKELKCSGIISNYNISLWNNYSNNLFNQRLSNKSKEIQDMLIKNKNNWEEVLFIFICKYFGASVNKDAFYNLVTSFDFKIFRQCSNNLLSLEALMFGQAGFLNIETHTDYIVSLKKEYLFLKAKYDLNPLNKEQFKFSKLRPYNFPTIKISQICNLYFNNKSLFSYILSFKNKEDLINILDTETSTFWEEHFTFEKKSSKEVKRISENFKTILIINSIVPILFEFSQKTDNKILEQNIFELCLNLKAEKNNITKKFPNILNRNTINSQSLIELHTHYCKNSLCLECDIFNSQKNRTNSPKNSIFK